MFKSISHLTSLVDGVIEQGARASAQRYGRRSILAKLGGAMMGGAFAAALPFDRVFAAGPEVDEGDDTACEYWRYCALDGFLCTTAGGSKTTCPVGSEASLVSWVGTCQNPGDGRDYLVSYNDCCGKTAFAGSRFCLMSEGERPAYRMGLHNDINWCMANENKGYHCTVAVVVGMAE